MDADSWSARLSSASKSYKSALQSRSDMFMGFEEIDGDDDIREEFPCPFCSEYYDIVGLCCHIDDEHPVEARNGVCPVCAMRVGVDMVAHITLTTLKMRNSTSVELSYHCATTTSERDEEDVAKLLCLYVCAKLFFATTGEHIGWAFVRVIDKLDTLQQYDWSATIRNTLIASLNEMHNKPEKVTGCVVALLFLICEHSNIIAPERPDVTPRFCRWNIASAVGKLRAINLSSEGCFEVHCAKLVGTINECHILKVSAAAIETKECGRIRMDVEPPGVCDERRAVIETDDVGSVEPSFNCWQPAKKTKGDMQMEGGNDYDNKNTGTPTSKEKVAGKLVSRGDVLPVLFPDLLELASTPDGEDVGEEQRGVHNELITCKVRITELESQINMKDVQICELEQRVETLEKLLGRHAGNLFANLNTVIVDKESEIARLKKQVDRLEKKISNLEDSLDDLEVHEVTQFAVNDGSNQRTPSNSVSGKVSGSANVTSCESAQQFACPTGQPEDVQINELQLVDNDPGIEDLTDDFADGIVHTTVAMGEGSCSPINAQTVTAGNVKDGAAVVVVEGHCEHTAGATSSGPKITSLMKRVKNKARREFRLSDYEYPGIFGRTQVNTNVRLGKSVELGVIYSVEDVEVERKTWNGFSLNRRHTVWNMLKDEDRELLQRMYTLEGDGLIVWDGGHNGIQVHFTDIKDLVQQNSIHGNVSWFRVTNRRVFIDSLIILKKHMQI
ncbi:uncharacterized protein LOC114305498 [Camellia sinensis]|uniref:uncharacterized protein LOC114305498 n=1 Tax=Camellia sinensis TaxID=4442 RepID=UPI001035E7E3|nr:uncharacterized protein LOC114305498 [Camellia sinensis]